MLNKGTCLLRIDMYNNIKNNGKIYRKIISAYSEEFLLVSTKVLTRKSVMSKIKSELKFSENLKLGGVKDEANFSKEANCKVNA